MEWGTRQGAVIVLDRWIESLLQFQTIGHMDPDYWFLQTDDWTCSHVGFFALMSSNQILRLSLCTLSTQNEIEENREI